MHNSTAIIIDDDVDLCTSLSYLLSSVNLKTEVFHSAVEYLAHHDPHKRGCLLIDIRMPDISGLELQRRLMSLNNHLPIIFMTGHGDINMAVHAMKAGAFDFITKPFNDQLILDLIQKAIVQDNKRPNKENEIIYAERIAQLTKRELEVMHGMLDGKMNKVIAYELDISIKTVELHRSHVMKKMQVKSIAELVKICTLISDVIENTKNIDTE